VAAIQADKPVASKSEPAPRAAAVQAAVAQPSTDGRASAPLPTRSNEWIAVAPVQTQTSVQTEVSAASRSTAVIAPAQVAAAPVPTAEAAPVKPAKAKVAKKTDPLNPSAATAYASGDRNLTASQRQDQMWRQMTEERRPTAFAPFGMQRF
jgi:hypothetical protein